MRHRPTRLCFLLVGGIAASLTACDVEPTSAIDYDAVAHFDLATLKASPWAKRALAGDSFQLSWSADGKSKSKACVELLRHTDALTLGVGHERVEVYASGSLATSGAQACIDEIRDHLATEARAKAKAGKKAKGKASSRPDAVRGEILGDDLVAIVVGPEPLPAPSRARLGDLLATAPSASGTEPLWLTAHPDGKDGELKYIEGWADPATGLDAHLHLELPDAAKAAELHGQAQLALTALRLSGELGGLGSAIELTQAGDTITADVHATQEQMKSAMKASKVSARADTEPGSEPETKRGTSFSFSFGS